MSPLTIIDAARFAAAKHSDLHEARLAFHVGYLEASVYELCDLLERSRKVMDAQKNLLEQSEKGSSASL